MILESLLCADTFATDYYNQVSELISNPYYCSVTAVLSLICLISQCVLYSKAGRSWWAALIPFYNIVVACRIAKMSGWNMLWTFVPIANVVFAVILTIKFTATFNKGVLFTLGMLLFPYLFSPILAFGKSRYIYTDEGHTILQ